MVILDSSGGRKVPKKRVLGDDAVIAARLLFGIAGVSLASVVYAVVQFLSTPVPGS